MIYKVKGTTDDITNCECCGRANLKSTVIMAICDHEGNCTGNVRHFGRVCAARHAGRSAKEIAREARQADKAVMEAQRAENERKARAESNSFIDFVARHSDASTHFERLQGMGGFKQAMAAYKGQ